MVRDHYLPAGYIGMFSAVQHGSRRDRPIWHLRRGREQAYQDRAHNLLHARDLYDAAEATFASMVDDDSERQRRAVDRIWTSFEPALPSTIEALVASRHDPLPATKWLLTLVPFVASLFVRGKTFMDLYPTVRQTLLARSEGVVDVNADPNGARSYQYQRFLAPIVAAHWCVVHIDPPALITNDLALARFESLGADPRLKMGWIIPLTPGALLAITLTNRRRVLAVDSTGRLAPVIEHVRIRDPRWVDQANKRIAEDALEMVLGEDRGHVEAVSTVLGAAKPSVIDVLSPWRQIPHESLAAHQYDWHSLTSSILAGPGEDAKLPLDIWRWRPDILVEAGWAAPTIFDAVQPVSGLAQDAEGSVYADLRVPQGYTVPYADLI